MPSSNFFLISSFLCFWQLAGAAVFDPRAYGAVGDGVTLDTDAIRQTLLAAANAGGGEVLFDKPYTFLTGCLNVTSNIVLNVKGRITGSQNASDYVLVDPLPWYGGGQDGQSSGTQEWQALIRSFHATNITLTGGGVIDGRGQPWWRCLHTQPPLTGAPCNGVSRPNLIMFTHTTDILVQDITLKDSPSWQLHLANCTNVHVNRVTIIAEHPSPNTDGYDIDCSVNVLVENSYYSGGDDAVAIKSGVDYNGRTFGRATQNVTVRNFTVGFSHGISVGSEMSAGVYDVLFENCLLNGSDNGIRVKSQRGRGGLVRNITYRNIQLYNVKNAIYLTLNYNEGLNATNATATPQFANVVLDGVYSDGATNGWLLDGLPESHIQQATFSNVYLVNTKKLYAKCDYISGQCLNQVLPSCPPCLEAPPPTTTTTVMANSRLSTPSQATTPSRSSQTAAVSTAIYNWTIFCFVLNYISRL